MARRSNARQAKIAMRKAALAEDLKPVRPGESGGQYRPLSETDIAQIDDQRTHTGQLGQYLVELGGRTGAAAEVHHIQVADVVVEDLVAADTARTGSMSLARGWLAAGRIFSSLPPGRYLVNGRRKGYLAAGTTEVTLPLPQEQELEVFLDRAVPSTIRVLDERGYPLPGATLWTGNNREEFEQLVENMR